MATRTRYFVITSLLVLTVGLGTGLLAYYVGFPTSALSRAVGPDELRLVPTNASLVGFADVQTIMASDLRQKLRSKLSTKPDGHHEFQDRTGIDIETDIDRIVVAVTPDRDGTMPRGSALVLARGRFDQVKVEALMREHGAMVELYKDSRVVVADSSRGDSLSLSFLEPGLAAIGTPNRIHGAIDLKAGGSSITTNDEVMRFVRDIDSSTAWVVGRFDVLASHASLPPQISQKIPPIQWFSASAQLGDGVRGTIRAEARDEESGNALRDVVRGVMALVKLQVPSQPGLDMVVRSLELGGTGQTVTLSFDVPTSILDMLPTLPPPRPPIP